MFPGKRRARNASVRVISLLFLAVLAMPSGWAAGGHAYNGSYSGDHIRRIAFPLGGIGAGMICLEGTGTISHVSVRNKMDIFNEPCSFAALCIKEPGGNVAKVLEGQVQDWKVFGAPGTGNGASGKPYGLPRFDEATFLARFPFATVTLADKEIPLNVELTGWSPFVPSEADMSSLPLAALEYRFSNPTNRTISAVFSYNTKNFMDNGNGDAILPIDGGFVLWQPGTEANPEREGAFAIFVDDDNAVVDHCWFKGGWWDSLTLAWRNVAQGNIVANPPQEGSCPGASLFVPFTLRPGQDKTVQLKFAWYVPVTTLRYGQDAAGPAFTGTPSKGTASGQQTVSGFQGEGLVNTFDPSGDAAVGTLTSPVFELKNDYIHFLVGGGRHVGKTCVQLVVDDQVARSTTGTNSEELLWATWYIATLKGKQARIRIVDEEGGGWGHILVDQIIMTDNQEPTLAGVTVLQDFEAGSYGNWTATGPQEIECTCESTHHIPWYAKWFESINVMAQYWRDNYDELRARSALFRDTFYDTTLPAEVVEAVAANLTILKSPTVLRQTDGRLWCFEGCGDDWGCCHGSCTHVWNYAQALCHLFPDLERTLRRTEFNESQAENGHQTFRSCLPIRPVAHTFHAASDGQLGGIMKVHRDWRISVSYTHLTLPTN